MDASRPVCLFCDRSQDQVPLIPLQYRDQHYWICPQHLPILIHKPEQLADELPGAEDFGTGEEHHH